MIRFGTVLLALLPAAGQTVRTPTRSWTQESAYAGSRICAGCHGAIYARQEASNHAGSLRPPAATKELTDSLPIRIADRASGATLTLTQSAEGKLELEASKEDKIERITLEWAFGSGAKGITPVGRKNDGTFVESRISWYAFQHQFGLTTGAAGGDPKTESESLGRNLSVKDVQECFSCHTTGYAPDQPAPARSEMGIRCERCHGPGAEHVRVMQAANQKAPGADKKIFHPGTLDAFSQAQMCGSCHGRPPRDTDLDAIRLIEQSPNTVRFSSQRLVLSRCFNESADGLKCTRCHDPHTNVVAQRQHWDTRCLACHSAGVRAKARTCPIAGSNCVSCHMPSERVMRNSEFTDHWIRVVRERARR